jgi:hypothetical protein
VGVAQARLTRAPVALVHALAAELVARQVEFAEHVRLLARSWLEAAWTESRAGGRGTGGPLVATGAEIGHPAAPSPRRHAERPTEAADLALAGRTRRSHPAPPDWTVRILCYAAFDPFAGIGQTVDDFRAARAEVALPCLLHDVARAAPRLVRRTCGTVG